MAQNFKYCGDHLDWVNDTGSTVESGEPVVAGGIVGIALGTIADDASGVLKTEGVFELTKKASLAIAAGEPVFWDSTPGEVTKTAADGKFIGYAAKAADASDATVDVVLPCYNGAAANVAAVSTANGSDAATTQALANQLKTTVNAILTALKDSGQMLSA